MSSDQTRAGLLLLEREGGGGFSNEFLAGVFFSLDDTRERGGERERKRGRKRELIPRKTKKRKRNQGASIHHIHTRKLIFLENRKTIS